MIRRIVSIVAIGVLASACSPSDPRVPEPPAAEPPAPLPPAPWAAGKLRANQVPAVYQAEWRRAANRERCALLAPRTLGDETAATPRAAMFSGGWSVAYDKPGLRSAFGIGGTGSNASESTYDDWPHRIKWADGSSAGYGPEGGTGANQLAYLRVAGQGCLYNVWSRIGVTQLESLLQELRFVE